MTSKKSGRLYVARTLMHAPLVVALREVEPWLDAAPRLANDATPLNEKQEATEAAIGPEAAHLALALAARHAFAGLRSVETSQVHLTRRLFFSWHKFHKLLEE